MARYDYSPLSNRAERCVSLVLARMFHSIRVRMNAWFQSPATPIVHDSPGSFSITNRKQMTASLIIVPCCKQIHYCTVRLSPFSLFRTGLRSKWKSRLIERVCSSWWKRKQRDLFLVHSSEKSDSKQACRAWGVLLVQSELSLSSQRDQSSTTYANIIPENNVLSAVSIPVEGTPTKFQVFLRQSHKRHRLCSASWSRFRTIDEHMWRSACRTWLRGDVLQLCCRSGTRCC